MPFSSPLLHTAEMQGRRLRPSPARAPELAGMGCDLVMSFGLIANGLQISVVQFLRLHNMVRTRGVCELFVRRGPGNGQGLSDHWLALIGRVYDASLGSTASGGEALPAHLADLRQSFGGLAFVRSRLVPLGEDIWDLCHETTDSGWDR